MPRMRDVIKGKAKLKSRLRRVRRNAERVNNRSAETQARYDVLSKGTFSSMKPAALSYNKRDKAGYLERREAGLAKQREHRDA